MEIVRGSMIVRIPGSLREEIVNDGSRMQTQREREMDEMEEITGGYEI